MRRTATLLLMLLLVLVAACGGSDTSEQIEGVWEDMVTSAYIEYDEEGQYQVDFTPRFGDPFEWGTYTFDGETLTQSTASEAPSCPDTSVTWTVVFSEDGDQTAWTLVEDSCMGSERSQDLMMIRQDA